MALGADVLIETFRPGVMERLGLGYEELSAANPRLVYGSVTGFGRTGPYADVKGYEALVMAPRRRTLGLAGHGGARRAGPRVRAVLQLRGQPAAAHGHLRRAARA